MHAPSKSATRGRQARNGTEPRGLGPGRGRGGARELAPSRAGAPTRTRPYPHAAGRAWSCGAASGAIHTTRLDDATTPTARPRPRPRRPRLLEPGLSFLPARVAGGSGCVPTIKTPRGRTDRFTRDQAGAALTWRSEKGAVTWALARCPAPGATTADRRARRPSPVGRLSNPNYAIRTYAPSGASYVRAPPRSTT